MLTAFSLFPTDAQFYEIEEFCRLLPSPVSDQPIASPGVDTQLYASALGLMTSLRVPELSVNIGWDSGLKLAAVRRLEETGLRYDVATNTFSVTERAGRKLLDDVHSLKRGQVSTTATATGGGFTLDDIQQVLSAANYALPSIMSNSVACGVNASGAGDASVDERALREITAYLQSETGGNKAVPSSDSGRDLAMYGGGAAPTNHDSSSLVVRVVSSTAAPPADTSSARLPTDTTAGAGTILVTDSNLPYLQQFLPNLQTVMQSVQSLVRCVPPCTSAGHDPQHRAISLPSLPTSRTGDAPGVNHKKRKHTSHNSTTTNMINSLSSASKDSAVGKPAGDVVQTKVEADSASTTSDGGFTCGLCSRTFTKRLGLSVHVQRAHGHRRSSESTGDLTDKRPTPLAGEDVKNCLMKSAPMSRLDAAELSSMCDVCGEIVSALDDHAAVCIGRRSPANDAATVMKCDSMSANTAVVEMLQLAEHFLRQHVPTASVSEQTSSASAPPPPPYSDTDLLPPAATPAASAARFTTAVFQMDSTAAAGVSSQPAAGKEIIYEGSRMREFVEYQCEACLLTFSSSVLANAHVAQHHTSASMSAYRVYACLSCSLRYRDPRIMRHHVVYLCAGGGAGIRSNQQLFPCSFCSKTFMSAEYMQLHVRQRHAAARCATALPVQCVLPTPPGAASVPSLEQLVSPLRRQRAVKPAGASSGHVTPVAVNHSDSCPVTSHDAVNGFVQSQSAVDATAQPGTPAVDAVGAVRSRSSKAKGILYKNVFMQCEGTYYCSVCHADLTGRESKRRHRQLPCGDPKTASYSRRYSYVCPYCSERFPSQKLCRQHQIDECLPLIGVGTAELATGEHRCPLCPKTCFGFPALKGHMMQAHHLPKDEASKMLADHEPVVGDVVNSSHEFNGVLSPTMSSPSTAASSTIITSSPVVESLCESVPHGDVGLETLPHGEAAGLLESDEDAAESDQHKELFPQLYDSATCDDGRQPSDDVVRPKRNRKSRSNEFFVMMFRNYPILAKGVSMCRSCAVQLEPSATTDSHAASCTGAVPADVRRSTLFRCTHCTATFWRAKDCRTHQLESCLPAHGVKIERLTEPSVACPMCEVRSYNRSGLMSHMKFRHSLDTDGVRQVMDRCGIRKSVPPPAAVTSPGGGECDDGSLSMDELGGHQSVCDGVMTETNQTSSLLLADGVSVTDDDSWRPPANMLLQRTSATTRLNN